MQFLSPIDQQEKPRGPREADQRGARDVAPDEPWVFFDHRTLAEVIAEEAHQ